MKSIGFILALALFVGVLFGIGYGLVQSWAFLNLQWSLLDASWQPVIILISSVIILCTLLIILILQSSFRKIFNSSHGKTLAYNSFMNWYVDADKNSFADINLEAIHDLRNEFLLWAGRNVVKQFNNLVEELEKENTETEMIKKYAGFIYIEIQRDLGRRGGAKLRQI
jgi:hypothetical protein